MEPAFEGGGAEIAEEGELVEGDAGHYIGFDGFADFEVFEVFVFCEREGEQLGRIFFEEVEHDLFEFEAFHFCREGCAGLEEEVKGGNIVGDEVVLFEVEEGLDIGGGDLGFVAEVEVGEGLIIEKDEDAFDGVAFGELHGNHAVAGGEKVYFVAFDMDGFIGEVHGFGTGDHQADGVAVEDAFAAEVLGRCFVMMEDEGIGGSRRGREDVVWEVKDFHCGKLVILRLSFWGGLIRVVSAGFFRYAEGFF